MGVEILQGDCLTVLASLPADSVHAVVTDPPYHLTTGKRGGSGAASLNENSPAGRSRIGTGFMGLGWDGGDVAQNPALWEEALRVAKPGAHLLAFGGTRTFHRMTCAIEDAGWEIRDTIMWVYGSGFPKSLDVSKAIDKAAGAEREVVATGKPVKRMIPGADQNATGSWIKDNGREFVPTSTSPATDAARQWNGWGTALKPAWEPIIVARKPLVGTVAENVQKHGAGALNIDASRIPFESEDDRAAATPLAGGTQTDGRRRDFEPSANRRYTGNGGTNFAATPGPRGGDDKGRWPANVIHDGSEEVTSLFPAEAGAFAPVTGAEPSKPAKNTYGEYARGGGAFHGDAGSAARFFYCAKASGSDRGAGNTHPTVKPTELMIYLVRLVTPEGGTVLDPFLGSGTTALAAQRNGCNCIGIELNPEYVKIAKARLRQGSLL